MYQIENRVRYSETDADGFLTMTGIINYFQDCSIFHSEDCGVGVQWLKKRHRAWMLSSWRILADRSPRFGEKIRISTWPYAFKGIYGYRNFAIQNEAGDYLVRADSTWFLSDTDTMLPVRVGQEDVSAYGDCQEPLTMDKVPRKIQVPEEFDRKEPVLVTYHHIDTNHHVNNAQYVEMARQAARPVCRVRELRAEYKRAAVAGDTIVPQVSRIQEGDVVSLCSKAGEPYAVIWMAYSSPEETVSERQDV